MDQHEYLNRNFKKERYHINDDGIKDGVCLETSDGSFYLTNEIVERIAIEMFTPSKLQAMAMKASHDIED